MPRSLVAVAPFRKSLSIDFVYLAKQLHPSRVSADIAVDSSPPMASSCSDPPLWKLLANALLAFAERRLLTKSSRQRTWSITLVYTRKQTLNALVSVIGGKADIISGAANVHS
jgi:hypothetical protein